MGTNYYLMHHEKRCESCGNTNPHEKSFEHIGKSSVGWHFGFNGMEHKTADEWKRHIQETLAAGGWISTEYDREHDWIRVAPDDFWALVLVKRGSPNCQASYSTNSHKTVCCDGVDFNDHTFS